jgi:hypothetical protein
MLKGVDRFLGLALACAMAISACRQTSGVPAHGSPLIGVWEGSWSYTNGWDNPTHRFRFVFQERSNRLTGTYIDLDEKQKGTVRVQRLVPTSVDKSSYRMEVEGDCWNVSLEGNRMTGVWNGGECSTLGVGSGARLIAVQAKRVDSAVR